MIDITVLGGEMAQDERLLYAQYVEEKYDRKIDRLVIRIDDEYVDLDYVFTPVQFDRIRRITGYLTGNTSTWNKSKLAELEDRVTHGKGYEQL